MPAGSAAPAARNPRGRERTRTPPAVTGTGTAGTQTQLLSSLRAGQPAPGIPLVRSPHSAGAGPCSSPAWEAHGHWKGSRSAQAQGTGAKIRDSDKHRLRSQEGPGRRAWPDPDLRLSATAELPKIQISWEPHIPAPTTHTRAHTHTHTRPHTHTHKHAHTRTHTRAHTHTRTHTHTHAHTHARMHTHSHACTQLQEGHRELLAQLHSSVTRGHWGAQRQGCRPPWSGPWSGHHGSESSPLSNVGSPGGTP